jgi:hypothetical protein
MKLKRSILAVGFIVLAMACMPETKDPKTFTDALFEALKTDNAQQFVSMCAKKSDYDQWVGQQEMDHDEMQGALKEIQKMEEEGAFSDASLKQVFNGLRAFPESKMPGFWSDAVITEYEGIEPEVNSKGIESADVYLSVRSMGKDIILRIGELYKPGKKWVLASQPKWIEITE